MKILSAAGVPRIRADAGGGVFGEEARDRGEQGDGAAVDDAGQAVAGARKQKVEEVHVWRPRRSRFGELVQWDTSEHDWLEGRGREAVPDRHDRRCDQPVVRAVCAAAIRPRRT